MRRLLWIAAAAGVAPVIGLAALSIASRWAPKLGLVAGSLSSCPRSPNCVCSQDVDAAHRIEPLRFEGDADLAWSRLLTVLRDMPRTTVIHDERPYLRTATTSAFFRFVDDVEFLLDEAASVIHVRSASRVGYSDAGANRARVEEIRRRFDAAP